MLTLHVSPFINEVEQMAYAYTSMGNEYNICDSVRIGPETDTYILHAYVPYEERVLLLFSKRGPVRMEVIAHPNEKIELDVTEEDNTLGLRHKKLRKGSKQHEMYMEYWKTDAIFGTKIRQLSDSLSLYGISDDEYNILNMRINKCSSERIEYMKHVALSTESPVLAELTQMLLKKYVNEDEYRNVVKRNYKRFPNYPPIRNRFLQKKFPAPSEQSKRYGQIIRSVGRSRVAITQDKLNVDTLTVGEKLDVILVDSLNQLTPLSAYQGKYVLVEMWASWCVPCIRVMPNILRVQQMFKDNLICCTISIDKDFSLWKRSVRNEKLQELKNFWGMDADGHLREDMKRLVAKGSIPRNYLLDREGRIIAIDIYGEALIKKLEELTKE